MASRKTTSTKTTTKTTTEATTTDLQKLERRLERSFTGTPEPARSSRKPDGLAS